MLGDFSWFQPAPRNFSVSKATLRIWRRWGKDYQNTREFKLLKQIEAECEHAVLWLLPYRDKLRQTFPGFDYFCQPNNVGLIHYYMAYCPAEMIPICIWLISKCADRFHLYGISEFRRDMSPNLRKHVAKALRRLQAWPLLEEMAALYPEDAKVQWFATAHITHRPFADRLSNYVQSVDDSHAGEVATPSRMPFWSLETYWDYTPPKSVQLIRRMLRRIRHWVRWGVS